LPAFTSKVPTPYTSNSGLAPPLIGRLILLRDGGGRFVAHTGAYSQPRQDRAIRQRLRPRCTLGNDLESTVANLKEHGVTVTLEPNTLTADGHDYKITFIEDPDCYKIELVQRGTMKVGDLIQ
jgi:hypothetical protein